MMSIVIVIIKQFNISKLGRSWFIVQLYRIQLICTLVNFTFKVLTNFQSQ